MSIDFKILKIKIFDAIGKLMLENNISGFANNFQISVSHLAPGTYFMQASSALETSIQNS